MRTRRGDPCNPSRRALPRLVHLSDDISRAVNRARCGPHTAADVLYTVDSIEANGTSDGVKSPVKHLSTRWMSCRVFQRGVSLVGAQANRLRLLSPAEALRHPKTASALRTWWLQ